MRAAAPKNAMIKDAKRYGTLFDPRRLKLARETRRLTQKELATAIGYLTAPAISQFESGTTKPSAQTLVQIASVLHFPVTFFTRHTPFELSDRAAFFRSLRSAPAKELNAARALAEVASLLVTGLEKYVQLPEVELIPRTLPPTAGKSTVEKAAAELRASWGIAEGPITNVLEAIERHGIVVVRLPLSFAHIDAFSVFFEARPLIVLSSDKDAADRSRFDAAHELGHLVMHVNPNADEHARIEKQAHWFAAAFLAPTDELVEELPTYVDWQQLAQLKRRWGLSIASLLMRARDLKRISESEYVQAMKYMSMKGWRKREPVQIGAPERPSLLGKASQALSDAGVTVDLIGAEVGLPSQFVDEILGASVDRRPRVHI
jgi:Zn-dependent peptidase ImmA (M78 family)/DNA-binding XRE family transcriptional regulator